MKITKTELDKIIADTVINNMKLNKDVFSKDLVKDSLPIQIAVQSTIKVLSDLGLIDIKVD